MPVGLEAVLKSKTSMLARCVREIGKLDGVVRIILFGSYAKGTQTTESDIDLAVFFNSDKLCLLDEYRALVRICMVSSDDIQVQAFGSYELEEPCGIIEEIVKFGIELPVIA